MAGRPASRSELASEALLRDEEAASRQARATHKSVVVSAETNTGTLVTANPNGSFTLTETSEPVRVKQHGVWVPVNADLVRGADGGLHAAATATAVSFSAGGAGPMATMASGADRLSFTFPYVLPRPTVSGPNATYRNVLPGVDLELTANAGGFSELLIVQTHAAAISPALCTLRLRITSAGVTISGTPDGGAQAVSTSGDVVFHTDTAAMWDSAAPQAGAKPSVAAAPAARGGASGPGLAARVGLRVNATAETLIPDPALLDSPRARFPIYIDPAWSGNPSQLHWARISSNGWDIYDSTSTAGADHPRSGLDDWPGGAGELARTFYQMNTGGDTGTSGIGDAHVTAASMYVVNNWSAYSASTDCDLYLTGQPKSNGWNSTDLTWSNQPGLGTLQSKAGSYESSSGTVVPGTLQFDILNAAQAAANGDWTNITFELKSDVETGESAPLYWKQYASGGGATISVTYYRDPDLVNGTGEPVTSPAVTDAGTTFVTSKSPTMKITSEDTDGETVRNIYQIYNYSGGTETTQVGGDLDSGYSASGGPMTYGGSLADGTYAWRAESESDVGHYYSAWTAWQKFTVDTSDPPAPGVGSPQFPANEYGGAYSDQGTFTLTTDGSDNVKGYLFSLDGDLGSVVYGGSGIVTWTAGTKPVAGKVYWIPATTDPNGYASATFAPGTVGPHRVYAKAVDQADNTSASETTYLFYAGFTTPFYVDGDQFVNGYTASDGTVVPPGTVSVSGGGELITQANCCGIQFADGYQAVLANGSGKVENGDSMTLNFYIPATGVYDFGANLTDSWNYGEYTITLDANSATGTPAATLISGFDGYSHIVSTTYRDFGPPKDSTGAPIVLPKGVYSITLTITGENSASAGYQAGIDVLRIAPMSATCSITSISGCYNNSAIAANNDAAIAQADADGSGDSLAADQLASEGWNPGTAITVNGAPMTLPGYATGKADNIVTGGQTVTIPSGYANDGDAVEFLAFATNGAVSDATGTITYASACSGSTTQGYTLSTVPDWMSGPASAAAVLFPGRNTPGNPDNDTQPAHVYAISVPLTCTGTPISSITLPVVSNGVTQGTAALHILAVGIRASSFTDTTNTQNWTATFAAKEDTHFGPVAQTTVRMAAVTSVGGSTLRIHLSNALGTVPVKFDDVTVGVQSTGAATTAAPTPVTFGGSASVTIPAGGSVTSDAVSLATTQEETLLVSVHMAGSVSDTVGHEDENATAWTTTSTADDAGDQAATAFTQTMGTLYWLTGVDVTSPGNTNGSVAFYGDQTINSDTSGGAPNRFTDDVAADLASGNAGTVPYGILDLGENSSGQANNLIPTLGSSLTPLSVADPIDRDVLDQANIRTVLISTGTSDILAGESYGKVENDLVSLVNEIKSYSADTIGMNPSGLITVYVATIPPSSQFTTAEEGVRKTVNQYICGPSGSYLGGNANGCIDFAAAVASDGTDTGSTVAAADLNNSAPDNAYYAAEAQAYVTQSASLPIGPDITSS